MLKKTYAQCVGCRVQAMDDVNQSHNLFIEDFIMCALHMTHYSRRGNEVRDEGVWKERGAR